MEGPCDLSRARGTAIPFSYAHSAEKSRETDGAGEEIPCEGGGVRPRGILLEAGRGEAMGWKGDWTGNGN